MFYVVLDSCRTLQFRLEFLRGSASGSGCEWHNAISRTMAPLQPGDCHALQLTIIALCLGIQVTIIWHSLCTIIIILLCTIIILLCAIIGSCLKTGQHSIFVIIRKIINWYTYVGYRKLMILYTLWSNIFNIGIIIIIIDNKKINSTVSLIRNQKLYILWQ